MAQVNQPNVRPPDDALTTLIKGLSIARDIYGIRTDMAKLDEAAQKEAKAKRLAAGEFDKGDQIELAKNFDVTSEPPKIGVYQTATDAVTGGPLYVAAKRESSPLLKEIKGVQNGVYGTVVKDYRSGRQVDFIPDKPEAAKTREVEYQRPDGVTVKGIVPDVAGAEYIAPPKTEQKPSKEQFDAALYGRRLQAADSVFNDLTSQGYDRSSMIEGIKSLFPEASQPPLLRQQVQAERNFLNAVLRRESGAVISPSEFENGALQYFPRAGDTAEVLAQKAQNRQQALAGLQAAAGKAWEQVPLVAVEKPKKSNSGEALAAPSQLAPGVIEGGYIFQGGDPGDRNNWKKK